MQVRLLSRGLVLLFGPVFQWLEKPDLKSGQSRFESESGYASLLQSVERVVSKTTQCRFESDMRYSGSIVQWLGHQILNLKTRVRLSLESLRVMAGFFKELATTVEVDRSTSLENYGFESLARTLRMSYTGYYLCLPNRRREFDSLHSLHV